MNYYEVGVGAERYWKSAIFTYNHDKRITIGTVVKVPFGNKNKFGYIINVVNKPTYDTKPIDSVYDILIPDKTLLYADWFKKFYLASEGQVYSQFLPKNITKNSFKEEKTADYNLLDSIVLNKSQKTAVKELSETGKPSVLHGVTGSGKTRIYISIILEQIKSGKNVLFLYPEISLTSQLVNEIKRYAPVVVFHSQLKPAQKSKLWVKVAQLENPTVIMGPRSAMFLPHKNIGTIIIDESHESSFKQESEIRYNGLLAAGGLARTHKAKLIMGSATPPISESEQIIKSGGNIVCLHERAIKNESSKTVEIIDIKNRLNFKKHKLLSDKLIKSIEQSINSSQQSLLFINRRGTAKLMLCTKCDWQATCPNCDLPQTYHHDKHKLICHTCGTSSTPVSSCPACNSETALKSFGSKAIVEEVTSLFPGARIGRFDSDQSKEDSFSILYEEIKNGKIDILIGTQQIAKGLDLPLLTTVGVLNADLSTYFPDYSSDERTFQLISQVAGRVGRGHADGRVFIQTRQPNSKVLDLAVKESWHKFKDIELINRQKYDFPPFIFVAKIIIRDKSLKKAETTALKLTKELSAKTGKIKVLGPIASFIPKKSNHYYFQVHLLGKSRSNLLKVIEKLDSKYIVDIDPINML